MGFSDQRIVALSGTQTIGRIVKEGSGACPFGYGNAGRRSAPGDSTARKDGAKGIGMAGGGAWTKNCLTFDSTYFSQPKSEDGTLVDGEGLVWLPTDACLWTDPGFKPSAELYAKDQAAFFRDYAKAHKKFSELGSKFDPAEGITL